jgi:murein DD-endopeptidase MepM/ murein hydrolase activator NlpD
MMNDSPGKGNHSKSGRMGFMIVMLLMFSTAVFLTVCASNRSAGVAWGNLQQNDSDDKNEEDTHVPAGFVVIDMSGAVASEPEAASEEEGGIGPLPADESAYSEEPVLMAGEGESTDVAETDSSGQDQSESGEEGDSESTLLSEVKPRWEEYTVKSGETLGDIASRYNVSADEIARANELKNPNKLTLNQQLLIPVSSEAVDVVLEEVRTRKARVAAKREKVKPLDVTKYKVANGDSLWSISNTFSLEIDTLFGSNDLKDPNVLKPGIELRIPNQDGIFYTVKKGDTLGGIVKKFQISKEKTLEVNGNMDLNSLKAGEEIFLPEARPEVSVLNADNGGSKSSSKSGGATYSRSFRWPVVGRINSPFGWRRHPVTRRKSFHTGIDIKASRGYRIRAAKEGHVVYSGWMGGYGRVVVLSHGGGYSTLYAHCSKLAVRNGQKISQGQVIAYVGSTGRATGPHLHFEVRMNNRPINPLKVLR